MLRSYLSLATQSTTYVVVFQGQVTSAAASYSVISRYRHCRNFGAAKGSSINSTCVVCTRRLVDSRLLETTL